MSSRMRAGLGAAAAALTIGSVAAAPAGGQLPGQSCQISDGGRILTAGGGTATFGGSAATSRERLGHQVYVDHGPTTPLRFRSFLITEILCIEDGRQADIRGMGFVDLATAPPQEVRFHIRVRDLGELPFSPPDTYYLETAGAVTYSSGEQPVTTGNIQITFD
jgi:hypothetical protein